MIKKKNKIFIKKNKINFILNAKLDLLKILHMLGSNNILIFTQFLSLNSKKNEIMYKVLKDIGGSLIYLTKKKLKLVLCKKAYKYLKNFNTIVAFNDLRFYYLIEKMLLDHNIIILGIHINKVFFHKKDFNLENIIVKKSMLPLLKRKVEIIKIFIKIILILKKKITIVSQKNGNN